MKDQERLQNGVLMMDKLRGETPLEALKRLRMERSELAGVPLSYAGRLDPIAEGVLLVVVGETNKNREEYLHLDKEYEVDILWGVSTDTGDILGIPGYVSWNTPEKRKIVSVLPHLVGECNQEYPAYSSKTVNGKPLWEYAREGKLGDITMPTHHIEIENMNFIENYTLSCGELYADIQDVVSKVTGDFRQAETLAEWNKVIKDAPEKIHFTRLHIACSHGTYVRQLVSDIGERLETPACVYKLKRTRAGEYVL